MQFRNTLVMFLLFMFPLAHAEDNPYLQELIQQSHELHLAERVEWLNLLHYKPYVFLPGSRSLADDPSFFNAVNGKSNAAAELEVTLAEFFSKTEESNTQQNPQCRFVARYNWLNQYLRFDSSRLQVHECKRFNAWKKAINPNEMTLVYPAAHLNSPASMYGHTLLRIDAKDQNEHTRLLAYTVGYTATTDEKNGFLFALGSLFGWIPGTFQMLPYYLKVQEYSDMENRDIWEYRLNLTPQEIDLILAHIWEVGPTYFDYYFLDENCAYHLLSMLEIARPNLKLTDQFRWWAIPTDTVRAVAEKENLMVEAIYRPSNVTVIKHRVSALPPEQRNYAKLLSMGKLSPNAPELSALPVQQQAAVTELSLDYLTYLQSLEGENEVRSVRIGKLLLARSVLDAPSSMPEIKQPNVRPDQGHKSARISVGAGRREGVDYQELAVRPAYHDQNDPGPGYIRGAQIQFFNLTLRHFVDAEGLRVEEFIPLDIFSLAPRSEFFQSLSWKVNIGWARKRMPDGNEPLVTRMNVGAGYAWDTPSLDDPVAQTYAFMDGTLESAAQYSGHYALGVGPAAGVIVDMNDRWRINAYARLQRYGLGEIHTTGELSLLQRYTLGAQTAARLELTRKMEFNLYSTDVKISLQQYF
jgi:hypothetical protein